MSIEERAKRFLASYSKHGGQRRAKSFRQVGEMEQCKIAGGILGEMLRPDSGGHYYLTCPGIQFHSNKAGRKDCRFTPGGVGSASNGVSAPSLNCVHQSCATIIEEMNRKIRSECGKAGVEYLTDHGSVLNNAAAALIIGFNLSDVDALKLLNAWGKTCTPIHTAAACGSAVAAALAAYKKSPDEVGYLLKSTRTVAASAARGTDSPCSPSEGNEASYASAHDLGELPKVGAGAQHAEPIYIGAKGRVAKVARMYIDNWRADYGRDPECILLGPDQPEVGAKLCGLPVERMESPGISVHGRTMDA